MDGISNNFLLDIKKNTLFLRKNEQGNEIVYVYDSIARIGGMERILTDKMNYWSKFMGTDLFSLLPKAIILFLSRYPTKWNISNLDTKFHLQYQHPLLERLRVGWTLNHKLEQKLKKEIKLINPDIISGNTSFKADLICKLVKAKKIIESPLRQNIHPDTCKPQKEFF